MNRKEFKKFQADFFNEAHNLMARKNADYATGGDEEADAFANFQKVIHYDIGVSMEAGVFTRLLDKISRLSKLMKEGYEQQVTDESIKDTSIDIANYASIICAMVLERNNKIHKGVV